jgi:PAS domain S-box-containing protein
MGPSADPAISFLHSPERRSAFLENVISTCPEGIIANDTMGNIFLYNRSAERIFGYPPEEAIGKISASRLYPPGGAREVKEYLYSEEFGGRGHLVDFETEILRKDGKRVPIRLCCSALKEDGKEIGYIGFFTDITARISLQANFLESEERFRGIFESARDAIVSVGEDGKVVMANRAAQKLLGYGEESLAGMETTSCAPPTGRCTRRRTPGGTAR